MEDQKVVKPFKVGGNPIDQTNRIVAFLVLNRCKHVIVFPRLFKDARD